MDTIQKNKHHFNLVDLILILLLIAIVGGMVFLWTVKDQNLGDYPKLTYAVTVENVPLDIEITAEPNTPIYDDDTGKQIGTLISMSEATENEQTKSIVFTIRAEAILNADNYYQIGSYTISIGKSVSLRVGDFWGSGACTALTPGEKEA